MVEKRHELKNTGELFSPDVREVARSISQAHQTIGALADCHKLVERLVEQSKDNDSISQGVGRELMDAWFELVKSTEASVGPMAEHIGVEGQPLNAEGKSRHQLMREWMGSDRGRAYMESLQRRNEAMERFSQAYKAAQEEFTPYRNCAECGKPFKPTRAKQIYHDDSCARKARQRRWRKEKRATVTNQLT